MLHIYYGTDRLGVRDGATKFIDSQLPPEGTLTTLESSGYMSGQISDALGASSLFGGEEWFVLDTPSDDTDFDEETKTSLKEMSESANTFVILEGTLLAPAKKAYGKYAETVEDFTAEKNEHFNIFSLADALSKKDKRKLWLLLQEARLNGSRDENIIGVLWWQLKSLRLAAVTNSAAEAGMKDFPYSKSKRALGTFRPNEIIKLSQSLLELYHSGHGGMKDMDTALEQWVLELK